MLSSQMDFLFQFGWNDFFESQNFHLQSNSMIPARVIGEERNAYRLQIDLEKTIEATVSGKLQFNAETRLDFPAVGDWVIVDASPGLNRGVILELLRRKSLLYRKQVGRSSEIQILSANIDRVFIATDLNSNLNYRRIERYLAIVWESGATPTLLLTKADLHTESIETVMAEVRALFPGVEVYATSIDQFTSSDLFSKCLTKGTTSVFLGSSGVGKSTLVNFLIGSNHIKTQSVRESDGKGRHTTTSRNLYQTRFGGLIIDTPGMREVQLSDHTEGLLAHFSEFEVLIQSCRFGNCHHESEPGCAIQEALLTGRIEESRWRSFLKLRSEVRHEMRKHDKALASLDRKKWKRQSRAAHSQRSRKLKI